MSKTKPFFSCWFQKQPGVVRVLTYKDIPGINSPDTPYDPNLHQELLCSGQVLYAGQAVALVLAGRMEFCFSQFHGRINALHAKFFRGNINIYLHFVSFLHIDTMQVVEILPQIRQRPTYST